MDAPVRVRVHASCMYSYTSIYSNCTRITVFYSILVHRIINKLYKYLRHFRVRVQYVVTLILVRLISTGLCMY